MIFKKGERVVCRIRDYTSFNWGPGTIKCFDGDKDLPDRVNPAIMIFFDNGEIGLLFENEIEHVSVR